MEDAPKPSRRYTIAARAISSAPAPPRTSSDLVENVGQTFEAAERMVEDVVVHDTPDLEAGRLRGLVARFGTTSIGRGKYRPGCWRGRRLLHVISWGLSTIDSLNYR